MMFVPHRKHTSPLFVTGTALLLYVDDVCTSLEAHVSTACYGDSFTFLAQTSKEMTSVAMRTKEVEYHLSRNCGSMGDSQPYGHLRPVMGITLLFYMCMMSVPHRNHTYRPPRPVSGIVFLFYMYIMFVHHRKHTYESPRPVTGIAFTHYRHFCWISSFACNITTQCR
jgi:hypothetical protein